MKPHTHIEPHATASRGKHDSLITHIGAEMPYNSHKALKPNTHTVWDNPGCLSPQYSTEVSGITLVDWLDKDT